MNIDISIIKLILKRDNYNIYNNIIYKIKTEKEIYNILLCISKYYEEYKEHNYISSDELQTYFYSLYPSQINNKTYSDIFDRLRSLEVSDSLAADIVLKYLEKETASEIMNLLLPVLSGDGQYNILQIPEIISRFKEKAQIVDEEVSPFIEDDLASLMDLIDKSGGLKWGLSHLNENIGPLPGCTLGHVFARVECGKTTFISSQVQNIISQLVDDQKIIWFCNEEHGRFVKLRTYQSLLNLPSSEIHQMVLAGKKGELEEEYNAAGGAKIKILYDANLTIETMRAELEKIDAPRLIIVDIADHVTFRGDSELNGPNRLGELYRRYRSMASQFSCDILSVGQASAECDGKKVLHMDHMHNSKTDKPGALDYAIGIGKTYDPNDSELRWLTICKNKIGCTIRETSPVRIDTVRGRMYDV